MHLNRTSYAVFAMALLFVFVVQPAFAFQVFLDAGHGGQDQGASRGKITEAAITLKVVKRIGADLSAHQDIHVSYTRTSNVYRSLEERVQLANRAHPDLFLSVTPIRRPTHRHAGKKFIFKTFSTPIKNLCFSQILKIRMHNILSTPAKLPEMSMPS